MNQGLVAAVLGKAGYNVILAADGQEALGYFGRLPFDLILMDVQMPRMDDLAATRRRGSGLGKARAHRSHDGTRHEGRPRAVHSAGMDDYLTKPVDLSDLRATIRKWTEQGSTVSLQA